MEKYEQVTTAVDRTGPAGLKMEGNTPVLRQLPASKYNLDTYFGRVRHCMDVTDPRTLLVSEEEIEDAKELVRDYKLGKIPQMNEQLWRAKKILDSSVHPDTGRIIYLPWRMSSFVLTNLVVTAGMLNPGNGPVMTVAWQFINQSVNVAINGANANQSTPMTNQELRTSYLLATTISCSIALGLNSLVPRLRSLQPTTRTVLSRLVPFAAVVTAGMTNVFLMRMEEMYHGIYVTDHEGTILGSSKKAGRLAVSETAVSRALNATPVMVIPPLILLRLQRTNWLKNRPRMVIPTNLALILGVSLVALPCAIGAFPQRQRIHVSNLEPEFQDRLDRKGEKIDYVWFNRGV